MNESQMGKRFWIVQIKRLILGLASAFAIGLLFDQFFNDDYLRSGIWAGVAGVGLYLLASVGLSVVNLVSGLVYNLLWRGNDMQEAVLQDLRNANLPAPEEWHAKRMDYLEHLIADPAYPAEIRIKAASIYAAYSVAYQRAGFFGGVALAQAANDAVLRYAQEAPRFQHTEDEPD